MIIPIERALEVQVDLFSFADVGGSCGGMVKSVPDGKGSYLTSQWQIAVDNMYRYIKSDLIFVVNEGNCAKFGSLFEAVQRVSPFGPDDRMIWAGTILDPTEKLLKLIESYRDKDIRLGVVNSEFIEEVERIFAKAGVPWSLAPLLPIVTSPD